MRAMLASAHAVGLVGGWRVWVARLRQWQRGNIERDAEHTRSAFGQLLSDAPNRGVPRIVVGVDAQPVGLHSMSDSRRGVLFAGDGGAPFPSAHPFGFQYFDFFEPTAKLRRATLAPTEMMRAARSSGASPPSADATTVLEVVPVLGSEPGSASGFLA